MSEIILRGMSIEEFFIKLERLIESKRGKESISNEEKNPEFITRKEAAKLLRISLPTLNDWTKIGWLVSYKLGNRVYYKEKEIAEALTSPTQKNARKRL